VGSLSLSSSGTRGGGSLTVAGSNFGTVSPRVTVGDAEAQVLAFGHEAVTVRVPAWQGAGLPVRVEAGGQLSAVNNDALFSYSAPTIGSLSPAGGPTRGGGLVTIEGANFGVSLAAVEVVLSDPTAQGSSSRIQIPSDGLVHLTHEQLTFVLPEGQGVRQLLLTVGGQASPDSGFEFRYFAPVLYGLTVPSAPTEGGVRLRLHGDNFGLEPDWVRIDGVGCADVQMVSHSELTCLSPPGHGTGNAVQLSVGGQLSNTTAYAYDPPEVERVSDFPADAIGSKLVITGVNFGETSTSVNVTVGTLPCANAQWVRDSNPRYSCRSLSDAGGYRQCPYLTCDAAADTVGLKNVSVTVAEQTVQYTTLDAKVLYQCESGFYGQTGELCTACPDGAVCAGVQAEPVSAAGWWMSTAPTPDARCSPNVQQTRSTCPYFLPCEPKDACLGENECAGGYTGDRCSACATNYYRLNGECKKCPNNAWLLIVGFLLACVVLCMAGYVVNRKRINISFVSIGVDYFQVLALFYASKVKWPPALEHMFQYLSAFNFNIDLTAPECTVPNVTYAMRWSLTEALPLGALVIFVLMHMVRYLKKRCVDRRTNKLHSHGSALLATGLTMFYYLYLYITRTTLEVFNCSPTDPPDGKTYMSAEFIPCYEAGGTQMKLLFPAIVTLLLYTIGFPAMVYMLLRRNHMLIVRDQLLLSRGLGTTRLESLKGCYSVRKRYQKMYYHYKPWNWYWCMAIIGRKFMIAFTALMFRKNPSFQLSVALLVLFASFVLQVKYRPFMSPSEFDMVWAEAVTRAGRGEALYVSAVREVEECMERATRARKTRKQRIRMGSDAPPPGKERRTRAQRVQEAVTNYNTVELVLLGCAVLVALAGVMLDSDRFADNLYTEQRDTITVLTIIVVVVSIFYYAGIVLTDMCGARCPTLTRIMSSVGGGGKGKGKRDSRLVEEEAGGAGVELKPGDAFERIGSHRRVGEAGATGAAAGGHGTNPADQNFNPLFASDLAPDLMSKMERMQASMVPADELERVRRERDQAMDLAKRMREQYASQAALHAAVASRATRGRMAGPSSSRRGVMRREFGQSRPDEPEK